MAKQKEQETSNADYYKSLFKKMLKKWYIFVISITISFSFGQYIYKSSPPLFTNSIMLLMAEDNGRGRQSAGEFIQIEMFNTQSNLEDELAIISSFPVINRTLKELDLTVSYFIKEGLYIKETYKNTPFTVIIDSSHVQPLDLMFEVNILSKKRFELVLKQEGAFRLINYSDGKGYGSIMNPKFSKEFNFGQNIETKKFKFIIKADSNLTYNPSNNKKLYFVFNNIDKMTYQYKSDLTINKLNNQSSMVFLEIKGGNSQLVTDFLNKLAEVYLDKNLGKKNNKAKKTIEFIDGQIAGVADSLSYTASKLKDFRTANKVMDINYTSQNLYNQLQKLEEQKAGIALKEDYYRNIKNYVDNNETFKDLFAPSSMGVDDPQLINLINQLTELNAEYSAILKNNNLNHPELPNLKSKIKNIKKNIKENVNYIVAQSNITTEDIDNRIEKLTVQVNRLPLTEKELKYIEREFNLNDATYTYLLQKHSEAEIARASNSPDYEIIEPAKILKAKQVSPKKKMIYFSSFFVGLLVPIAIIFLLSAMNNTIENKHQIEAITNFQIIESIARNDKDSILPAIHYKNSLISESFRATRTNFLHFNKDKKKILITSTGDGEGKSFIAMNLAATFSLLGKKTLLIEYDLRNPKIADYLNLEIKDGLSSYLDGKAKLENVIHQTHVKNFDVLATGIIPLNPVELIASDNTKSLIETLESQYDYIIIDTPPMGIVSDSYILMELADINFYVARLNYTNKKLFTAVMKNTEQKGFDNFNIIINDDDEQAQSAYYEKDSNASYFMKKYRKIKDLVKIKKKSKNNI